MKKRGVPLALYLTVCLAIIVSAYFHLSRIAQNFNTQHLELITGLYAEKMNESMEYLQNYVKEDVKMIQAMENKEPEKIQKRLEKNLNQKMFSLHKGLSIQQAHVRFKQLDKNLVGCRL